MVISSITYSPLTSNMPLRVPCLSSSWAYSLWFTEKTHRALPIPEFKRIGMAWLLPTYPSLPLHKAVFWWLLLSLFGHLTIHSLFQYWDLSSSIWIHPRHFHLWTINKQIKINHTNHFYLPFLPSPLPYLPHKSLHSSSNLSAFTMQCLPVTNGFLVLNPKWTGVLFSFHFPSGYTPDSQCLQLIY